MGNLTFYRGILDNKSCGQLNFIGFQDLMANCSICLFVVKYFDTVATMSRLIYKHSPLDNDLNKNYNKIDKRTVDAFSH